MDLLKNIISIVMNLSMALGFFMMLHILRAIYLLKKDQKVLDFIKKIRNIIYQIKGNNNELE